MAKSPEVKSEEKFNKEPYDKTKSARIKKMFHKIADWFAVSTPGGASDGKDAGQGGLLDRHC